MRSAIRRTFGGRARPGRERIAAPSLAFLDLRSAPSNRWTGSSNRYRRCYRFRSNAASSGWRASAHAGHHGHLGLSIPQRNYHSIGGNLPLCTDYQGQFGGRHPYGRARQNVIGRSKAMLIVYACITVQFLPPLATRDLLYRLQAWRTR